MIFEAFRWGRTFQEINDNLDKTWVKISHFFWNFSIAYWFWMTKYFERFLIMVIFNTMACLQMSKRILNNNLQHTSERLINLGKLGNSFFKVMFLSIQPNWQIHVHTYFKPAIHDDLVIPIRNDWCIQYFVSCPMCRFR